MIRRRSFEPPTTCRLCRGPVTMSIIHTSALHGNEVCTSTCANLHLVETPVEATVEEVCPLCETAAVKQCNCVQQTKTCVNGHAWTCRHFRHVTTRPGGGAHICRCDACQPPVVAVDVDVAAANVYAARRRRWWRGFAACYR